MKRSSLVLIKSLFDHNNELITKKKDSFKNKNTHDLTIVFSWVFHFDSNFSDKLHKFGFTTQNLWQVVQNFENFPYLVQKKKGKIYSLFRIILYLIRFSDSQLHLPQWRLLLLIEKGTM